MFYSSDKNLCETEQSELRETNISLYLSVKTKLK